MNAINCVLISNTNISQFKYNKEHDLLIFAHYLVLYGAFSRGVPAFRMLNNVTITQLNFFENAPYEILFSFKELLIKLNTSVFVIESCRIDGRNNFLYLPSFVPIYMFLRRKFF